jgi:hypothetical protein
MKSVYFSAEQKHFETISTINLANNAEGGEGN